MLAAQPLCQHPAFRSATLCGQAIGATTPFFTAFLGLIMLGTLETPTTYLSLVPVVVGGSPELIEDVAWLEVMGMLFADQELHEFWMLS